LCYTTTHDIKLRQKSGSTEVGGGGYKALNVGYQWQHYDDAPVLMTPGPTNNRNAYKNAEITSEEANGIGLCPRLGMPLPSLLFSRV